MNWKSVAVLLTILLAALVPSILEAQVVETNRLRRIYMKMRSLVFRESEKTGKGRALEKASKSHKLQTPIDETFPFPCNVTHGRSLTPPKSVHELRPGDIDVIGAIGDSLTAANGATGSVLLHVLTENRGMSALIGGQGDWRKYLTLPNILKEFNPKLIGYSLGDSLGHHTDSQFNVAEPAAMSQDINFMARELVKRMKNDKRVNFKKDWKLVTLFIGSNDFCLNNCFLGPKGFENSAEVHRRELTKVLDYLRDNLPRTLVIMLLSPNLKVLHDLKGLPFWCRTLHMLECPCLFGKARESSYVENIKKQWEWQKVQREVTSDKRYRKKEDFAVVLQTFTAQIKFPETANGIADRSFLSEDCFHLSQKGYSRVANAIWNNMLEPIGKKSQNWNETFTRFLCPTEENPFIFTHGNSFKTSNGNKTFKIRQKLGKKKVKTPSNNSNKQY